MAAELSRYEDFEAKVSESIANASIRSAIFRSIKPSLDSPEAMTIFSSFGFQMDLDSQQDGGDIYRKKKISILPPPPLEKSGNENGGAGGAGSGSGGKADKAADATKAARLKFDVSQYLIGSRRPDVAGENDEATIMLLLRMIPHHRSNEQAAKIGTFLHTIPFFSNFTLPLCRDIAKFCTLLRMDRDLPVYEEGEKIDTVYIILSGSVGVRHSIHNRPGVYSYVVLKKGESFGDVTMVLPKGTNIAATKTLTHVTLEETYMVCVSQADYKSILSDIVGLETKLKLNFCKQVSFLKDCTLREMHKMATSMTMLELPRNSLIFKQGSPSDCVYFTHTGNVRLIQRVNVPVAATPNDGGTEKRFGFAAAQEKGGRSPSRKTSQSQLIDLGTVKENWFFGELGVLTNSQRSAYAYAETDVILLKIGKEDFFNRTPSAVLMFMQEHCEHFYKDPGVVLSDVHKQLRWQQFKTKLLKRVL